MLEAPPGSLGLLGGRGKELRPGKPSGNQQTVGGALELGEGGMGVLDPLKGEVKGAPLVAGDERITDLGGGEALRDELF